MWTVHFLVIAFCLAGYAQSHCDSVFRTGLGEDEQKEVVDTHNNYRLMIANGKVENQPKGVNLKRMKWDDNLAKAAQDIADSCIFAHVSVIDGRWKNIGQNLHISYATTSDNSTSWNAAVTAWFDEHKDYTYGPSGSPVVGHYTQVVWAESDHVGCGFTHYLDEGQTFPYNKLYVCNYGPAGNIMGEVPYQTGTSGCENLC